MKKLTYCEKAEIWDKKKSWKQEEKGRKLIRATSLQQLERCAIESCKANKLLEKY